MIPGALRDYRKNLRDGQRPGQAFFNALPMIEQAMLVGTLYDPFYRDDKIEDAVEFLVDRA